MSTWISFVKKYAKKHDLTYPQALKDPKCSMTYKKIKGGMIEDEYDDDAASITPLPDLNTSRAKAAKATADSSITTIRDTQSKEPQNVIKPSLMMTKAQKEIFIEALREKDTAKGKPRNLPYSAEQYQKWEEDRLKRVAKMKKNR